MTKKKDVKIGIIGTSKRGQTHIRNIKLIKELKVTAICDRYENLVKKAYNIVEDKKNTKCYTDYKKMLKEADIEAVFVVVEAESNIDIVCDALKAGKHVMCEWPLTLSVEECWRVVLAVEKSGMKFQMTEQRQYSAFIESWKNMVANGELGKILFAEAQYFHPMGDNRFWVDSVTGEMLTTEEAKNNPNAVKSRLWNKLRHWILYSAADVGPFLRILNDRVKTVSCMGTRKKSYVHKWLPISDMEIALMHTEKDTLMRIGACFSVPNYSTRQTGYHWYHMMGTGGRVETNRTDEENMKMWLADSYMSSPAQVMWKYTEHDTPKEALKSGHGGMDYYPQYYFLRSILDDTKPVLDVYRAADITAPAIMAAKSAEMNGKQLEVPDFRPNKNRKSGEPLKTAKIFGHKKTI